MRVRRPNPRTWGVVLLLSTGACSGSISCGSCAGIPLDPIPGGFDDAARIERSAQIRVSRSGLDFLENRFSDLVNAYARQACGAAEDPPCPGGFGTSCDTLQGVCVDNAGVPQPVVGFEVDYTVQGSATVCRDPLTDPNRRECWAWLRLEGLGLTPEGPDRARANITARILTNQIPIRYASGILDLDCVVTLDSARAGSPLQDIELVAQLSEWTPPSGSGGRQLEINVVEVNAQIPDEDLLVAGDPIQGGAGDALACGGLNALGFLKAALLDQLTAELGSIIGEQLDAALGWRCGGPQDRACPSGTTCNPDGYCEVGGRVVPVELGLEGRMDFATLLGGFGGGRPGQTDLAFLVGGQSTADNAGINIAALGGAELVRLDPTCAQDLPSPRLRPTFSPPPALPIDGTVDLDWDGVPETPYMVAAGLSESFLDQIMWSVYGSGLFCQRIGADDVELLNTGSLGLLLPSLEQITHADKYPWAVYPASLTLTPTREPVIRIDAGEIQTGGSSPTLVSPLVEVVLDDLQVDFYAMLEERWMRLMTVQADLTLGFGATVNPNNEIELVIGDLGSAITDVRVSNAELLAESPQELADAIPALIQLALPQITSAIPAIPLPGPESLGGFELQVLGVRGVEGATPNLYPNLAVYADLDFFPALAGNLRFSADTRAQVLSVDPAGEVVLGLEGEAGPDDVLEHQVRVDGGLWSPFFQSSQVSLRQASLAVPGRHAVQVRSRVAGDYRSLDPTPAELEIVVDGEPPRVDVRVLADRTAVRVRAVDRVSRQRLSYFLVGAVEREVQPDSEGLVAVPELADPKQFVAVAVVDEQGLRSEVTVQAQGQMQVPTVEGQAEVAGCTCTSEASSPFRGWAGLLLFGMLALHRRRR